MSDEDILSALQTSRAACSAVELADLLGRLTGGKLSQGTLIMYFKRAFPSIPLKVLLDAGAWHRVSAGTMTDAEFEELLNPWLVDKS